MKRFTRHILSAVVSMGLFSGVASAQDNVAWTASMQKGNPALKSAGPLAFGPEGILFVADTKSAAVVAIATGETAAGHFEGNGRIVEGLNQKLASLLGTAPDQVAINDLAVNPVSRSIYLSVSRGRGPEATPVIARVTGKDKLEVVSLDNVTYSKAQLPDAPIDGVVGEGRRQSNPRMESITDIAFFQDRVIIAGLANEEFASTLRAMPFPFKSAANGTTVEIYHGAHGAFETRAPIRTLVPFNIGNQPHILAAYTCTPLVQFPVSDLTPGAKIKGKTIAELGSGNRPIDMIVYQKGGKEYLLLSNSARGIMKISTDAIESAEGITAPARISGTKGQPYETIKEWTGVEQLDKLDAQNAVIVRKADGGAVNLESVALP